MDVDEAVKIKNTEIAKHLSLPPVKLHCSMLAEDAIKAAVKYARTHALSLSLPTPAVFFAYSSTLSLCAPLFFSLPLTPPANAFPKS